MSLSDWSRSETVSKPSFIEVAWETIPTGNGAAEKKTVQLQSTDVSKSQSTYQSFSYTDAEGASQKQDVVVYKEDVRRTTRARVNLEYVSERLKYGLGLPAGDDLERSVTTYEYTTTADGPKLTREKTTVYISGVALAGQLQDVQYAWELSAGGYGFYDPPGGEFISHETIVEYEEYKTAEGREYTRRKTSRWISAANNPESKASFVKWMKALKSLGDFTAEDVSNAVLAYTSLMFEGTEVNIDVGRLPPPSKPSDEDVTSVEVVNGRMETELDSDSFTPSDRYGNDLGWTSFVPEGTDWRDLNSQPRTGGVPAWNQYVPQQWQDYNVEGDAPGVPKWAAYIPQGQNWQDFVTDVNNWQNSFKDDNGDGVPNWAEYTPIGWEEFDTVDSDYVNTTPGIINGRTATGQLSFGGGG